MAYAKQTWDDLPLTDTALEAARLQHLEDGLEAVANEADTLQTSKENTGVAATVAASAVTAHVAAADPHTQYLNAARAGGAAYLNVGTATGTVAAGDDARIVGAVQKSTVTTKGDLLAASASGVLARLPVGTDGKILVADSSQATGLNWLVAPVGKGSMTFNVKDYGAKVDGVRLRGITANAASTGVTTTDPKANFTSADVGKKVVVLTDTTVGTITTIAAVNSATSITLTVAAGLTVSGTTGYLIYGTDDSAAITAALTAAALLANVDTTVGPNQPQGLGKAVVLVPHSGSNSLCILGSQVTTPGGVRLETDSMLVNMLTDRYAPAVIFNPFSASRFFTMECLFGTGVQLGSAAGAQADVHMGRIYLWHVGKTVEATGLLRSQDGVALLGYGFSWDFVWMKGGARGIWHNAGSDCKAGAAQIIGAHIGVSMSQSNQVRYHAIILDSCGETTAGYSGVILDNACSDVSLGIVQAFCVTGLTRILDNVVLLGNGSTNKNVYIRFAVMAQKTGGNGINLQQAQDIEFTLLASNTASNSSGGSNITTGVVFGTVAGSMRGYAEYNSTITPYSGTVPGPFRYTRGGVEYSVQGGTAPTLAAGSNNGTTPPVPQAISGANDARGKISFGSGTSPAIGNQVVVTFASGTAYVNTPTIFLEEQDSGTKALNLYPTNVTATGFTIASTVAPTASKANTFYNVAYRVEG